MVRIVFDGPKRLLEFARVPGESFLRRFERSLVIDQEKWRDGIGYDLDALRAASAKERDAIESLLLARGARDWRDVEALAALDTPRSRKVLAEALKKGSAEVRLAVARHAPSVGGDADRIRSLVHALETANLYGGLSQAIDQAAELHPPAVVDALLRGARERDGEAAVHFAALLFFIHGKSKEPFDWAHRPFFLRFAVPPGAERDAAFRDLCETIGAEAGRYLK
jgi:hypothetical protein